MSTLDKSKFDHDAIDFRLWSIEDLAWAAGFIDGDGMISMFRRNDRNTDFFIKVTAVNTDIAPLEKLQLMFGGSICQMHKIGRGRNWKPSWQWSVSNKRAERVLDALIPFLVSKHARAALAQAARQLVSNRRLRRSAETISALRGIEHKFRELNAKGVLQ